jgi:hypothetical protein
VRIAFAAFLALLAAAPALAGSASTIHVGLIVTGSFASPLVGAWHARTAARGTIYHFVVSGNSGTFYQLVSIPLGAAPKAGKCDLRVSGVIHSLEQTPGAASYEMQYSIQSADLVTSSTNFDDCKDVAASYLSDIPAAENTNSLILSRTGEGRLIDNATGADYTRIR